MTPEAETEALAAEALAAEAAMTEAVQSIQIAVPDTVSEDVADNAVDYTPDDIPDKDPEAKSGPPKLSEWQDFFSRIVIKYGTDWYMNTMLRDIDPSVLQPSDLVQMHLSPDDRRKIARPFAELANKSKVAKKYGRTIVSSADSVESAMILMKWARTVSRIQKKYRVPKTPKPGLMTRHQHTGTAPEPTMTAEQRSRTVNNGNIGPSPVPSGINFDGFAGN